VLFMAEAVTLAHVARPVVLANALDPARYDVHLAVDPRYNKLFPDLPPNTRPLNTIPSAQFLNALAQGTPLYNTQTLCDYAHEDLKILNELKPDLVIGDFRLSLAISAQLTRTPYMTITNAYWSPYAKVRYDVPELPLTRLVGVTAARVMFKAVRPLAFALHTRPMNRALRKFNLPSLGLDLRRVYTHADHVLYADIPELIPLHNAPDTHHHLGPIQWSPTVTKPDWWDTLPTDKPIIYVTMGSSGPSHTLSTILQGLADLPVQVIAATAGRVPTASSKPSPTRNPGPATGDAPISVPDNALIADYLPGNEAAQRASLVICNGGSPTVYQALAAAKPVLAIPSNLDQYLNMDAVLQSGAARLLRAGTLTPAALRTAANDLLSTPTYTQDATRLAQCVAKYDAESRLTTLVEQVLTQESQKLKS
jgi:UDP:flavonoid glycosyltransferase YjiC (YdhE family)